jgi:DNA-binding NarL/FixJ family response regulator
MSITVSPDEYTRLKRHMYKYAHSSARKSTSPERRQKAVEMYVEGCSKNQICREMKMGKQTINKILRGV